MRRCCRCRRKGDFQNLSSRRCLIPADGFYEWLAQGKKKLPRLFTLADGGVFAMAGLFESWDDDGRPHEVRVVMG